MHTSNCQTTRKTDSHYSKSHKIHKNTKIHENHESHKNTKIHENPKNPKIDRNNTFEKKNPKFLKITK